MSHRASVLVVDDNPATLLSLKPILEAAGYEVYTSATGLDALQILAFTNIDLVLLDNVLPVRGVEVAECIKAEQPSAVVLLHTGNPDKWHDVPPHVDGVLQKPTPPRELLAKVAARLKEGESSG